MVRAIRSGFRWVPAAAAVALALIASGQAPTPAGHPAVHHVEGLRRFG